jgi:regulator of replication initiation timing
MARKNPCKYFFEIKPGEIKEFTEAELKDYLLEQDLSKFKTIQDAIQERSPEKMVQPTQAGVGETGGKRTGVEPGEQGQKVTTKGEPIKVNEKAQIAQSTDFNESTEGMTKIANAVNDAFVEGKYGLKALEDIVSKLQDTDIKAVYERVKEKIENKIIDPKDVRDRVMTNMSGSEFDQAVLLYDRAELEGREKNYYQELLETTDPSERQKIQDKIIDVQNQILDNALANKVIGRSASTTFRIRQMWVNRDMNLADMETQYKASKNIKELTDTQKAEIKNQYNEINKSRAELEKAKESLSKLVEQNAKLEIENEKLKELQKTAKEQKKADIKQSANEAISKSNERIQKSKEALKRLGGNLNAGFDPKIALELSKIAAEKVYQGIVKIDELVSSVYEDVKDVLTNFTKEDIAKHILAQKDKNGNYVESEISEAYLKSKTKIDLNNKEIREKFKAYKLAKDLVARKQFEWQNERRKDIFENKPTQEKIIDKILRWQRFAVLTYPSTFVKLVAAVVNQTILKPFKFLTNFAISKVLPKSIKSKMPIWGNPKLESLANYYSEFLRNFNVTNLKDQFSGIDTKELLYGNPHIYDEFVSARGLLEMPGRSHGYIKSFIKNPEFVYANTQQVNYHLTKMFEAQDKLNDENLSKSEREEWEKIYDENDVTNEDVMEKINKLSLEHARWSIFMNDSEIVSAFRRATSGKGVWSALARSEMPIVKIPVNYTGRYFLNKYGLIKSFAGSGKEGMAGKMYSESKPSDFPGLVQVIRKGTKDLTTKQADLLGRTLVVGSMGAAFFALGYLNRKNIKRNDDDSIDFFGIHINKNLSHAPEYESMFSGAETGHKMDGDESWLTATLEADFDIMKHNPFISMFQYGFIPNLAMAMTSKNEDSIWGKAKKAVNQKIANMVLPGALKQSAQWMDTESGKFSVTEPAVKRKAEYKPGVKGYFNSLMQEMMLGIPGLRNMVPAVEDVIKDYTSDENGKPITGSQRKEYEKLGSKYYDDYLNKAKENGAFIRGESELTPFNKLTDEQKKDFVKDLRNMANQKAKEELFGKKPETEKTKEDRENYKMLKSMFMGEQDNSEW